MAITDESTLLTEAEMARRKTEILKKCAKEMEKGTSPVQVVEMFKNEYIEKTGNVLTKIAVSMAFNAYGDKERLKQVNDDRRKQILLLKSQGKKMGEISDAIGISRTACSRLIADDAPQKEVVHRVVDEFVLTEDMVERFKEAVNVGDRIECKVSRTTYNDMGLPRNIQNNESVVIKSKYRHFCETDKGTFRWVDLYLYRRARAMA